MHSGGAHDTHCFLSIRESPLPLQRPNLLPAGKLRKQTRGFFLACPRVTVYSKTITRLVESVSPNPEYESSPLPEPWRQAVGAAWRNRWSGVGVSGHVGPGGWKEAASPGSWASLLCFASVGSQCLQLHLGGWVVGVSTHQLLLQLVGGWGVGGGGKGGMTEPGISRGISGRWEINPEKLH